MRVQLIMTVIITLTFIVELPATVHAEEVPTEYQVAIDKGLEWMARNQHKDGHWEGNGGQAPVVMTALGGMTLLMEGSTLCDGKYHRNIRRAVDWLMVRSQPNGLINDPNGNAGEQGGYMYGHGFAMLFLSNVVGEEEDTERRKKLVDILDRAAKFSRHAQSSQGGWIYYSARDAKTQWGDGEDEGSVTVTQLQALRAARNAGIIIPTEMIKEAIQYLQKATNSDGGVCYSLTMGGRSEGRPVLTAAAIVCGFSAGEYDTSLVKKWFKFCRTHVQTSCHEGQRMGHDEYTYYYYAQAIYMLGEDGWAKLFPEDKSKGLTWSAFRKKSFDALLRSQAADGSWSGGNSVGPVYTTAMYLSVLQLDKAVLPIYQR